MRLIGQMRATFKRDECSIRRMRSGQRLKTCANVPDIRIREARARWDHYLDSDEPISSPKKRSLLVADDDIIFRTVASELVRSWGYDCSEVADGEAALRILSQEQPPTIALLDWQMPGLTGPEICRRVRAGDSRQYIYFILISARDGKEDSLEGLRSGADTYISKPLDAAELRTKLEIATRIVSMEESLLDLHAETELFVNSVPSILIGTDMRGGITRWNKGAKAVFGITKDEANQSSNKFRTWWSDAGLQQHVVEVLRTGVSSSQNLPFDRNGEQRVAGLTIHPLRSHVGAIVGSVIIGSDVTEKKVVEDQLRQAQKLEAIGQLAAGIAHEINTPTQFVNDNVTFFKEFWAGMAELLVLVQQLVAAPSPALAGEVVAKLGNVVEKLDLEYAMREIPKALDETLDGLDRIKKIVRAMKEFSHPSSNQKRPTDLNAAIQTTITVSRSEWKYVADLDTDFDPNLPQVPCVVDQFNQAILNIIVNAAHAIADVAKDGTQGKGQIKIRTSRCGEWAEIAISDTGKGIPEEIRHRVFEPFFSTKAVGKGTGQGLALAHTTIVREHSGKVWFECAPGQGTTFFIRLPIAPEDENRADGAEAEVPAPASR